jgi:hypothetical protein
VNGTRAFIAVTAVFVAALIWIWRANHHGRRRVIGRRATLSELLEPARYAPVVHQTPEHDAVPLVTPCCSVPLAELPPGDHISHNSPEVTCPGGES